MESQSQNNSDYGIYIYSIGASNFDSKDFLQLEISGIPEGTFVMGYGQDAYSSFDPCKKKKRGVCVGGYTDYKLTALQSPKSA